MRRAVSRLLIPFLAVGACATAVVSSAAPAGGDIDWGAPYEVAGSLNSGGDAVVNAISCTSDGNCAAGGYYEDSSGDTQAFVVDEVGGVWGAPYEIAGSLNSGGDAWVNAISCTSDGNCAAGGRYEDGSADYQNFVVDEVGGVWGAAIEVGASLNTGGHAWVNSVSCSSDGNCGAGGRYKGSGGYGVFVVNEVDGTWDTAIEVVGSLNTGGDADLNSISCTSDGNCWAGGRYKDSLGNYQAFLVDEVDGVWDNTATEVAGSLNIGGDAQVFSVSCTSDGNCAAGGRYKDGSGNYQAFVDDETNGSWDPATEVAGSFNTGGLARVESVSCTSDGNCVAGGRYKGSSGNSQAFVVDEVDGVWDNTATEVAGLLNTEGDAWINSVACSSDGYCTAGGYYKDGSGNYQAFVVDEVDGVWETATEVAGSLNASGDAETNSVSCVSSGSCTLGGYYKDDSLNIQAFVVDEVHAVTFVANGGTGTMNTESSNSGESEPLTANAFIFTGYSFTRWNTAANGSGTAYSDGASFPFDDDVTLYAQWNANTEDVSFHANGGKGKMKDESYVSGVVQALTSNAYTFTGHIFSGWNTAANGSGTAYSEGEAITINAATSLYAQWTAAPLPKEIVTAHPTTVRLDANVRLRVHLFGKTGTVRGRVEVSIAGKTICSATLVDGIALCSVNSSRIGYGSHRLLAKYEASGFYRSLNKSLVVRVG